MTKEEVLYSRNLGLGVRLYITKPDKYYSVIKEDDLSSFEYDVFETFEEAKDCVDNEN